MLPELDGSQTAAQEEETVMFFDLVMDWHEASELVKEAGFDGWLKFVAAKFPHYKLYATSTDWYSVGPRYIAKLRGTAGDVIVGWRK
jgi:hypothetical protein